MNIRQWFARTIGNTGKRVSHLGIWMMRQGNALYDLEIKRLDRKADELIARRARLLEREPAAGAKEG